MHSWRISFIVSVLFIFVSLVSAATPTSFCKCTCGSESEIVALNAPPRAPESRSLERQLFSRADGDGEDNKDEGGDGEDDGKEEKGDKKKAFTQKTCNDCNRQFCIANNLPGCRQAAEKEIFTQCFQRDSAKDQAVVYIFIIATVGLLSWALIRPWLGNWLEKSRQSQSYLPVNDGER